MECLDNILFIFLTLSPWSNFLYFPITILSSPFSMGGHIVPFFTSSSSSLLGVSALSATGGHLEQGEKDLLLALLNQYRASPQSKSHNWINPLPKASNMMQLRWDDRLEQIAQNHTDKCLYKHNEHQDSSPLVRQFWRDMGDDVNDIYLGETLAFMYYNTHVDSQETYLGKFVEYIFSYQNDLIPFDFSQCGCERGEFCTQEWSQLITVLWAESELVGCAQTKCRGAVNDHIILCNLYPGRIRPEQGRLMKLEDNTHVDSQETYLGKFVEYIFSYQNDLIPFDFSQCGCERGEFCTQEWSQLITVLWAESELVGCAQTKCRGAVNDHIILCNLYPGPYYDTCPYEKFYDWVRCPQNYYKSPEGLCVCSDECRYHNVDRRGAGPEGGGDKNIIGGDRGGGVNSVSNRSPSASLQGGKSQSADPLVHILITLLLPSVFAILNEKINTELFLT
ncbi:uncharacterized protein LOC134844730 [Symsagittifera roscoffensis]|uniref:uncharacterized protein LOC134844730 n=1 Tax=Symsagittifera roscoffensis TaxID=84072 RepID=UPI00307C30F4